jgi:hypothetical protein
MGHDVAWLRGCWLHGLSAEIKASVDGGLIGDHRIEMRGRPSGRPFLAALPSAIANWHRPRRRSIA